MSIFSVVKHLIPQPHAFMDEDKRYNLGLTWTDPEGLTDSHNLELRYVRNSERLALQGQPQPMVVGNTQKPMALSTRSVRNVLWPLWKRLTNMQQSCVKCLID
jgi:hypothetical protein